MERVLGPVVRAVARSFLPAWVEAGLSSTAITNKLIARFGQAYKRKTLLADIREAKHQVKYEHAFHRLRADTKIPRYMLNEKILRRPRRYLISAKVKFRIDDTGEVFEKYVSWYTQTLTTKEAAIEEYKEAQLKMAETYGTTLLSVYLYPPRHHKQMSYKSITMDIKVPSFDAFLIRKVGARKRPSNIIYLDTETRTIKEDIITKHTMKLGWTCHWRKREASPTDSEKWMYWENKLDMQKYIESKARIKTTLYVIAHNVFFDLQVSDFFYWFTKQGWILDFVYDKGLVYILSIHKDKKRIRCISTTNFFPTSLKKLGDMVDLPKLDVDFEEATKEELKVYCRRDVEIIKKAMEQYIGFIDKHDFGNFMLTRGSQAFTAYRHRFLNTKIYVHRNEEISDFEKRAYYGGRVECGFIGEPKGGPFISLDFNSMYSYVMRVNSYPTKIIDLIENPDYDQIRIAVNNYCVIAHVYIDTDEPAYPYHKNNRIVFPVGRFETYLCTQGLEYALNHNHVVKVYKITVYEKGHIFDDYVDYLYPLKDEYGKQGNKIWRQLVKDYLNCLYGKTAQENPLTEEEEEITFDGYYREEILDIVTGKKEIITKLFNKTFIQWGTRIGKNSFIAIAAHVTEYARFHLYKMMKIAGLKNVLYVDTDSIKIRYRHKKALNDYIDNNKLGYLKVEENFKHFKIYGPKDYETENTTKIKGVPKSAKKVADNKYIYSSFLKQDSHLRQQITRYFITRETPKVLKRIYTKGILLPNGVVIPYKIDVPPEDRPL